MHALLDRTQKLKDARAEAEKEIEEYRKTKEQEFQAYERSVCRLAFIPCLLTNALQKHDGKKQDSQSAIDRDTEVKVKAISDSYESNKQLVVKKLLDRVVLVKPELHRNLKKLAT